MSEKIQISASIVLYNENFNELSRAINSFLKLPLTKKLYLIDNSSHEKLKNDFNSKEVEYINAFRNIGFGAGHNLVLDKIKNISEYHLILNPDVEFEPNIIRALISELERHDDVAMIAPKVVFPSGKHQHSCRRYPTIRELIARRIGFPKSTIAKGEYQDMDLTKPFYPDFLQGCFQLYKTKDFVRLKGFDERYFLYMEDVDICRKIDILGKKKLYFPKVKITHILKKESSKNVRLFFIHIKSSIEYFKKWGV